MSPIQIVHHKNDLGIINLLHSPFPYIPHPKTNHKIPRTAILIQIYPEHLSLDKCHLIKAEHHPRHSP